MRKLGWTRFSYSVLIECEPDMLNELEQKYIRKYKPLLNYVKFINNKESINKTNKVKLEKITHLFSNSTNITNSNIYLYYFFMINYDDKLSIYKHNLNNPNNPNLFIDNAILNDKFFISKSYKTYNNIKSMAKELHISTKTISDKLDTNYPYSGYLFYSQPINKWEDIIIYIKGIIDNITDYSHDKPHSLTSNISKGIPVYAYNMNSTESNIMTYYPSLPACSQDTGIDRNYINEHLNNFTKKGGIYGYIFSYTKLSETTIQELKAQFKPYFRYKNIYVYTSNDFELIIGPLTLKKTAKFLSRKDPQRLNPYINTLKALPLDSKMIILFDRILTLEEINQYKIEYKETPLKGSTKIVWAYKKDNSNKFIFIPNIDYPNDNNYPTSKSYKHLTEVLGISRESIRKYIDTNKPIKEFYLYSSKQNLSKDIK